MTAQQQLQAIKSAGFDARIMIFNNPQIIVNGVGACKPRYNPHTGTWVTGSSGGANHGHRIKKMGRGVDDFIEWCKKNRGIK